MLEDIRRDAGGAALHGITRAVGHSGEYYLEKEGWRAFAPAEREEVLVDAAAGAEAGSEALSLVTLTVNRRVVVLGASSFDVSPFAAKRGAC